MLSIEQIINDPEFVRQKLLDRGENPPIDQMVELDSQRRALVHEGDELRAKRNEVSRGGRPSPEQIAEMRSVGERIKTIEAEQEEIQGKLHELLMVLPNLPKDAVPIGADEESNIVVRDESARWHRARHW